MVKSLLAYALFALIAAAVVYGALVAAKGRRDALALVFGPVKREAIGFEQLKLKPTPNQYLVCPQGLCIAKPHAEAPTFDVSVGELQEVWLELVNESDSTTLLSRDDTIRQFDFETLTPLVGFPDTATVRFLPVPGGGSTLAIYSRSHYGRSDLGANKKRVDRWLALVRERLAEKG